MNPGRCVECGKAAASRTTTSGRQLCPDCFRRLGLATGAAVGLSEGQDAGSAIVQGVAAGQYAGAMASDREYQRRLHEKLATTEGFWRRLWVRVVG